MQDDDNSTSGIEWASRGGANRKNRELGRRGPHGVSVQEVEESQNFNMQTDFNYREENSGSGFDRDIHQ